MKTKILVFGATGMLGHTLFAKLSMRDDLDVYATARNTEGLSASLTSELLEKIINHVDADNFDSVLRSIADVRPDIVINCIGIIKQLPIAKDPLISITINALFPHRLAMACKAAGARLIHISTDCVFDGKKGNYTEEDPSDATDLYGRTKYLGEVQYPHSITLRTSIIGHELKGGHGLIEWFLAQEGKIKGYTNAIYSGFPTIEISNIISDYVIPNSDLQGLYHVSSNPISKYELLKLAAERYNKQIDVEPFPDFYLDRSLDSSLFQNITGYRPPSWQELIEKMYVDFISKRNDSGGS
jgi:dTDP-4-dehydrorhamnose reductase